LEFEGDIEVKGNEYPTLALTSKSNDILFGGEKIIMKQAKPREPAVRKTKKERVIESIDRNLYAELKALRRVIADEKNVPAYIVFSDATLVDMCKKLPTTLSEMLEVSGVGSVKLNMYGERFLQVLKSYLNLK
jgi:ATP-dependent DNA helicase RecQ